MEESKSLSIVKISTTRPSVGGFGGVVRPAPSEFHPSEVGGMATVTAEILIARNPATNAEVGRVIVTPVDDVGEIVERARAAQRVWAGVSVSERLELIRRWWKLLSREADSWADLIRDEIGKPRIEALAADVLPTLDALRWTVRNANSALQGEWARPGWQRWLLLPAGRVEWVPLGVVGMIGTWNYPLFLNAPLIAHALAAGNAVVWKPSELASLTGARIQRSLEAAGLPPGLVATVIGDGEVGKALVDSAIDKGVFTGGIENGRRVLSALAERGIPAVAELSGFDPAIVLNDAPLDSTIRAVTWGAFVGCGQTCVSIKRLIVVGDPTPWAEALAESARALRVGNPADAAVDIGPLVSEQACERFHQLIRRTVYAGARILTGGERLPGPGSFYPPTVLLDESRAASADSDRSLAGAFGPVVLVRGVPDIETAIAAANSTGYGLAASVWSRDLKTARGIARRLQAGTVAINEAVTPTSHITAPFGGMKASGHGRTHGVLGLREFAQTKVVFTRKTGGLRPQLYPYGASALLDRTLAAYRWMFHPGR
jgi:acyl-CoA reductase-like NAD-dependent aldehyde dehydrogenase